MIIMLERDVVRRYFGYAVEWLYEQGKISFPKNLNTNKQFRVKTFDGDMITFDVFEDDKNLGGFVIFVAPDVSYDFVKEGNTDFVIRYFLKRITKDMYDYHLAQLR